MDFQRVRPTAPRSFGQNQGPVSMSAPPPPPPQPNFAPVSVPRAIPIMTTPGDAEPNIVASSNPQAEVAAPTPVNASPTDLGEETKTKKRKRIKIKIARLPALLTTLLIVSVIGVYYWQHQQYINASSQARSKISENSDLKKILTDQKNAQGALPNITDPASVGSQDLLTFLATSNTGCYKTPGSGKGWHKVNKVVNDQFAEVQYGCQNTYANSSPALELAVKNNGQWKIINPVSQWLTVGGVQYPVCGMITDNKISKVLEPKCVVQLTVNNLPTTQIQDVTNP